MRKLLVWVAILTVVAVIAGPATAGGKGGSSIQLIRLSSAARTASADPSFSESVTFQVSTSEADPWVTARCYRGGALVLYLSESFRGGAQPLFQLGPTASWWSGDADCTASLVKWSNGRDRVLASTVFHVVG